MTEEETLPSPPKKAKSPIVLVLVIIIVLGLISLGGMLFWGLKKSPENVAPTPTPTIWLSPTPEASPTPEITLPPTSTPTASPQATISSTPTPTPKTKSKLTSTPAPNTQADLYISAYSFDHPPKQGEAFTVSITIYNQGGVAAGPFLWEWWATNALKQCRERISEGLPAHGGGVVTCTYTYGGWADYVTKAVVDPDNEVSESNEANNTYTQNLVPIH